MDTCGWTMVCLHEVTLIKLQKAWKGLISVIYIGHKFGSVCMYFCLSVCLYVCFAMVGCRQYGVMSSFWFCCSTFSQIGPGTSILFIKRFTDIKMSICDKTFWCLDKSTVICEKFVASMKFWFGTAGWISVLTVSNLIMRVFNSRCREEVRFLCPLVL